MYQTAIANAEKAGDGGKARRYKRGLKVQKTFHVYRTICVPNLIELDNTRFQFDQHVNVEGHTIERIIIFTIIKVRAVLYDC